MSANNNLARNLRGVTATLRDRETRVETSRSFESVAAVAAWCDEQGPSWRVVSLSTWRTILADLTGHRVIQGPGALGSYVYGHERASLAHIGRIDLLDAA